jgi:hypothetical protein
MEKDNLKQEKQCVIHDVMHSLVYQPTHIEVVCEKRMFKIKAPINWFDKQALYYAGIMDLLDKKHSFQYYMWCAFESNCV